MEIFFDLLCGFESLSHQLPEYRVVCFQSLKILIFVVPEVLEGTSSRTSGTVVLIINISKKI
jgi:hypothetical protein